MIPYFILLFLVIIIGQMAHVFRHQKASYRIFIWINALILILFAGLRNSTVGTDTGTYVTRFLGNDPMLETLLNNESSMEIGYRFFEWLIHNFSQQYVFLLLGIALFITYLQFKTIYKISISPLLSIIVLITFGFYTFSFNGVRQAIALSIYLYALPYLLDGSFKKYTLFVGIAFLFHKTVIIMLPMYFVFRLKFSIKLLLMLIVVTTFSIIFFDNLLDLSLFISNKYTVYKEMNATGGVLLTIGYSIFTVFFIIVRKSIHPSLLKKYDTFLNMHIIGTIIYVIVQLTGAYVEITRLAVYFLISEVFLWSMVLKATYKEFKIVFYVFFVMSSLVFYFLFLSRIGSLIPYTLNTN